MEDIRARDKIWGFSLIHIIFNIMGPDGLSLGKSILGGTENYGVPKSNFQKYAREDWIGDWQKWSVVKRRALVCSKRSGKWTVLTL